MSTTTTTTITTTKLQQEILDLHAQGLTNKQIVDQTGASQTYVDAVLLRYGEALFTVLRCDD